MAREWVTLTVNRGQLEELQNLVGARSLSVAVDSAIAAHLARLRNLAALDEWLIEFEREHGPVPPDTLEWAARLVQAWYGGGPAASGGRADAAAAGR
jgi:hypothetical protein